MLVPDLYLGVLIGIVVGFNAGLGWALRKVEYEHRQQLDRMPDIASIFCGN